MPNVGEVCEVYFHEQAPNKYAICVDPDDRVFLLINSECYNETTDIPVGRDEIAWLSHDSYVDTSEGHYVYGGDIRRVNDRIPTDLRKEICAAIETHGVMPPIHMNAILGNLRALDA